MVIFAFWLAAMLLCLAALALLLPPLLRRQGSASRRDLERQLAELKRRHDAGDLNEAAYISQRDAISRQLLDVIENGSTAAAPTLGIAIALIVPIAALALYFQVGHPHALNPAANAATGAPADGMPQSIEQAVAALEQRLRQSPDDIQGWLLLARTYRSLERFDDMMRATSSAFALAPQTPDVMAEHAEAMTLASSGRRFGQQARELLESALGIDSQHQKSLWLLGVAELQAQRTAEAVAYWRRLRSLIADDDPVARSIDQQIANALAMSGDHPETAAASEESPTNVPVDASATHADDSASDSANDNTADRANDSDASGPQLTVTIAIEDTLRTSVAPGDTLFVFVRSPAGGPPLAIKRIAGPSFPVVVMLSQADRMLDGIQMELGSDVTVGARLSKSGQAQPQPGDIETSTPTTLRLESKGEIALRLNRVVE